MTKYKKATPINQRFGRLVIKSDAEPYSPDTFGQAQRRVNVECDCGTKKPVGLYNVLRGRTTSCGCLNMERLAEFRNKGTHGLSGTEIYQKHRAWIYAANRNGQPIIDGLYDVKKFNRLCLKLGWNSGMTISVRDYNKPYGAGNLFISQNNEGMQLSTGKRVKYIIDGKEYKTLEEAGNAVGITKEGVRLRFVREDKGYQLVDATHDTL